MWDESTRPTAPVSDGVPGAGTGSGAQLVAIHDHLRAELAHLRDLVERVGAGTTELADARSTLATMTLRQNNWALGSYCASYCRMLTMHHTIEDQSMFPMLRRADARLGPVLDRLQEEHVWIHGLVDGVDAALVALAMEPTAVDRVRSAVDALDAHLRSHLGYEEHELVGPLERSIGSV